MNSASSHRSRHRTAQPSAGGVCGDVVGQRGADDVAWAAVLRARQGDQLIVDPGRQSNLPYW